MRGDFFTYQGMMESVIKLTRYLRGDALSEGACLDARRSNNLGWLAQIPTLKYRLPIFANLWKLQWTLLYRLKKNNQKKKEKHTEKIESIGNQETSAASCP